MSTKATHGSFVILEDNTNSKILLVHHAYGQQKWSLPGGAIEEGELPDATAKREAEEEVMAKEIQIVAPVGIFSSRKNPGKFCFLYYATTKNKIEINEIKSNDEISECRWWSLKETLNCADIYPAQKVLIKSFLIWSFNSKTIISDWLSQSNHPYLQ